MREALEMEDSDIIVDLHKENHGHGSKFATFWENMKALFKINDMIK